MKKIFIVLVISINILPTLIYAQLESCNWFFGTMAAVSFCGGSPVNMGGSVMIQYEGTASISQPNGDMLFYTNGVTVYNRHHQIMLNGTGLKGHQSSTHSALIVPNPGNPNRYYVFTTDAGGYIDPPNDGFRYSEVDMLLDNGNGGIIAATKNTLLMDSCTEKIAAILHSNGTDYWVVTHRWNSNKFYSFRVTPSGISPPVISAVGSLHAGNDDNTIGQMKFNLQGNKLALAVYLDGFFELFDFDRNTGVLSNPVQLTIPGGISAYGLEFSPSGSLLYVTTTYFGEIYQFDIGSGNAQQIQASMTLIGVTPVINGSMQLAVDGKIYLAHDNTLTQGHYFLSVIHQPDVAGTGCNFQYNDFYLANGKSLQGLPSFPVNFLHPLSTDSPVAEKNQFSVVAVPDGVIVQWTGDGKSSVILQLAGLTGHILWQSCLIQQTGLNRHFIPLCAQGIYLARLMEHHRIRTVRFVFVE